MPDDAVDPPPADGTFDPDDSDYDPTMDHIATEEPDPIQDGDDGNPDPGPPDDPDSHGGVGPDDGSWVPVPPDVVVITDPAPPVSDGVAYVDDNDDSAPKGGAGDKPINGGGKPISGPDGDNYDPDDLPGDEDEPEIIYEAEPTDAPFDDSFINGP